MLTIWPVLLAAVVVLGIFFCALHFGWFIRSRRGFLLSVVASVGVVALLSACVVAEWGYEAGRRILFHQVVGDLTNVAEVAEANLKSVVSLGLGELRNAATEMPDDASAAEVAHVTAQLRSIVRFNRVFLQMELVHHDGQRVAVASMIPDAEPVDRIAVAFALEGKDYVSEPYESATHKQWVMYMAVPVRNKNNNIIGALTSVFDLQADLRRLFADTRFNESGYATVTNNDGRILAHPDPARINDDISGYSAIQRARAGETGWARVRNHLGEERLMIFRPLESPATVNPRPWVLLTEINEAEAMRPIRALRLQFLLALIAIGVAAVLIAWRVALSLTRPLGRITGFLEKVRRGELGARVSVYGRDEIGDLGHAINDMVSGLQERDRVKELFGRYVTTQVSEEVLKKEVQLGGQSRRVTILFSDIRNFTGMSEQMSPQQVVEFLNEYFSEMVEAVFEQGGVLDKFIGDGMMAVFGSMGDMLDHPRRAVLTALRMKALLGKINGSRAMMGKPEISIGIGIHTDEVIVGNIGSRRRLEYTVIGDGVNTSSRVEALNKQFHTTVLITETTYAAVKDDFEFRKMPETEIRGKTRALEFYEVVSIKESAAGATAGGKA